MGHWKFDNPADLGLDSSGLANHGSIAAGAPLYTTDSIKGVGAIEFDGIDDYLYLYDTTQGSLNADFSGLNASLSMWIKLDNAVPPTDAKAGLLYMSGAYDNFYPRTNTIVYLDVFDQTMQFGAVPTVDMTKWHHLVVTYSKTSFMRYAYQNGQVLVSGGVLFNTFNAPTTPWLGKNLADNYLDGKIDDLRLYNHELNLAEINALYTGTAQPALEPYPTDGKNLASMQVQLQWLPGITVEFAPLTSQTVYFGTNNPPTNVVASGDGAMNKVLNGDLNAGLSLDPATTYYWQVDAIDPNDGTPTLVQGMVWSFTTRSATQSLEWLLDEGTGTTANDSIGTNHGNMTLGIYNGLPATWGVDPDRGNVLEFTDGQTVASVGDWPQCPLYSSDYTVSFWAKRTTANFFYEYVIWYDSISIGFTGESFTLAKGSGGPNAAGHAVPSVLNDTNWHLWTVTQSSQTNSVYKDGLLVGTSTLDPKFVPALDQKLYVAGKLTDLNSFLNGSLSKVKILNYAMTDDDIGTMYHNETGIWPCLNPPVYDFTGDCIVSLTDFSMFLTEWMDCGRIPASACD